jgi:isoleucyl-tRNA synthetase
MDILDVWFDSGCTHAFVLEEREDLQSPADLYLEGSDQHRGWFHSSLLESCGTREHAPYKAVLTHGFVLDEKGEKMSKSKGNVTTPQEIIKDFGADILRLWVITSDFTDDLRIGKQIINTNVDAYRRLRNSLRWLLGALDGFNETEKIDIEQSIKSSDYNSLPMLERWVLHRLYELDSQVRSGYDAHEYSRVFNAIFQFLTNDLSAYYFDIRKDSLYCDAPSTLRRRACRTILDHLFECLTKWLAPILSFTMEEVWQSRFGDVDSIHLQNFPKIPEIWHQTSDKNAMQTLRQIRRVVTGALEEKRANKDIGSSLEAKPIVYLENPALAILAQTIDLSELCITSGIEIRQEKAPDNAYRLDDVKSVAVVFAKAIGEKCERCWQVLPDVGTHSHAKDACGRCADAITEYRRDAA